MTLFPTKSAGLFLIGALALASCASVPLPPEAAGITLVPVPSVAVEIHRPRFRMQEGQLAVEGYVFRQHAAETTADSHIDLVFTDATGRELAVDTTSFYPRSLPKTLRLPQPHAYFLVAVPRLPAGTTTIEVRGHDGPHPR